MDSTWSKSTGGGTALSHVMGASPFGEGKPHTTFNIHTEQKDLASLTDLSNHGVSWRECSANEFGDAFEILLMINSSHTPQSPPIL